MAQRWEYLRTGDCDDATLARLGADGWELVSVLAWERTNNSSLMSHVFTYKKPAVMLMVFKRPVES